MKIYLILLIQIGIINYTNAQWNKVILRTDAPITETITDAVFINADTGFVATGAGILYKTIDGGALWSYDTINHGGSIQQIQFPSPDTGYMTVSGGNYGGTILKTINGGQIWFNTGQGNTITNGRGMHFFNTDTGMVGAYDGAFRTTDGGQTWQKLTFFDQGGGIVDLRFLNDTLGFAFYQCFGVSNVHPSQATLSITRDGGYSWSLLHFCDQTFPYITTEYYSYLLDDSTFLGFDNNLRLLRGNIPFTRRQFIYSGDSLAVYYNPNFVPSGLYYPHNIGFYNRQLGMVAYWNAIIRTENGGETWDITDFDYATDFDSNSIHPWLLYIKSITADKWIVMGNCGRIYMTENKGGTLTGINETIGDSFSRLYPNPVTSELNCSVTSKQGQYSIYSITGSQLIQPTAIPATKFNVDVSMLPSGIYYMAIQDDKQRYVQKFVKQ